MLLFGAIVVLNLIGLVMVLSASSVGLHRPRERLALLRPAGVSAVVGGIVLFIVTMRVDYRRWRGWRPRLPSAVVALVAVLVPGVGVNVNGSSRLDRPGAPAAALGVGQAGPLVLVADLIARRQAWVDDPHTVRSRSASCSAWSPSC